MCDVIPDNEQLVRLWLKKKRAIHRESVYAFKREVCKFADPSYALLAEL